MRKYHPFIAKAYSYEMGSLSSNNEIKNAVDEVMGHIGDKGCWVFDLGVDNTILKNFFISQCSETILRLKRNTKLTHKGLETPINKLLDKVDFSINQRSEKQRKQNMFGKIMR